MIALASFSKGQLINMLTSVALLSPIAHLGQMTSPLARTAAENFIAEVRIIIFLSSSFFLILLHGLNRGINNGVDIGWSISADILVSAGQNPNT